MISSQTTVAQMTPLVNLKMTKLKKSSLSNAPHEWEPPMQETITIAWITDCPMITVHTGKWYKVLINSGAAISLVWYSTYQSIEESFKTPLQPTTAKLNTANSSPMTALGMTALHLQIVEFKLTHNFVICARLPNTEIIFDIDIQKKFSLYMLGTKKRTVIYKGMVNS